MIMGYMNRLLMIFLNFSILYEQFPTLSEEREIGIYNILGMGKGHIAKMLAIEAVITAFISIFGGILFRYCIWKADVSCTWKTFTYDISVKFTVEIPVLEKTFAFLWQFSY